MPMCVSEPRPLRAIAATGKHRITAACCARATLLFLVLVLQRPPEARATSWAPPSRPLTSQDRLARSASGADVICVGRIVTVQDTIIPDRANPELATPYRFALLSIQEVMHGRWAGDRLIRLGSWDGEFPQEATTTSGKGTGAQSIFFLREVFPEPPGEPGVFPPFVQWQLDHNPYTVPGGLLRLDSRSAAATRKSVTDALARQTLESMARAADLVVVATMRAPHRATGAPAPGNARIDEVLAGPASMLPGTTIEVTSPLDDVPIEGQELLLLKKRGNGRYEIMEFDAGHDRIERGRLSRHALTLDAARTRVRSARGGR